MPDITMCTGVGCDMKQDCYRFTAEPNPYRQSFFCTPPLDPPSDEFTMSRCQYFCDNFKDKSKTKGN